MILADTALQADGQHEQARIGGLDRAARQRKDWRQVPTVISDVVALTAWASSDNS